VVSFNDCNTCGAAGSIPASIIGIGSPCSAIKRESIAQKIRFVPRNRPRFALAAGTPPARAPVSARAPPSPAQGRAIVRGGGARRRRRVMVPRSRVAQPCPGWWVRAAVSCNRVRVVGARGRVRAAVSRVVGAGGRVPGAGRRGLRARFILGDCRMPREGMRPWAACRSRHGAVAERPFL